MKTTFLLSYRLSFKSVKLSVSSVEDARAAFEADRDACGFGSRDLLSKVLVREGKTVVAEIYYNGNLVMTKK